MLDSLTRAGGRILATLILARMLTDKQFGVWVLIVAIESIVGGFASAMLTSPMVRLVPSLGSKEDADAVIAAVFRRAWLWVLVLALLLTAAAATVEGLGWWAGLEPALSWPLALAAIGSVCLAILGGCRLSALTAKFRARRAFAGSATSLATLLGFVAAAAWWQLDVLMAFWIGSGVGWCLSLAITAPALRLRPSDAPCRESRTKMRQLSWSGAGLTLAGMLTSRLHAFVLAFIGGVGGLDAVRHFGGANSLVGPLRLGTNTLVGVLEPRLSRWLGEGVPGRVRARSLERSIVILMFVLGVPGAVLLGALEPWFSRAVLGAKFPNLGGALGVAALAIVAESAGAVSAVTTQVFMPDGSRAVVRARGMAASISCILLWPLCWKGGASGAFAAILAAELVNLGALVLFRRPKSEIGVLEQRPVRARARGLVEGLAGDVASVMPRAAAFLHLPSVQVLCVHRTPKHAIERLAELVRALRSEGELVGYSRAVEMIRGHSPAERRVFALSFDDGLLEHDEAGRILEEMRASACFFACAGWCQLSDQEEIAKVCRERLGTAPTPFMSVDGLRRLRDAGHEVGCHSWGHWDLSDVGGAELGHEIADAARFLRFAGLKCEHFAWPYGRMSKFSLAAGRAVAECGMLSCASTERGVHVGPVGGARTLRAVLVRREVVSLDEPLERIIGRLRWRAATMRVRGVPGWTVDGWESGQMATE